MIYINFLAWRQRIVSLACFASNVVHPWTQVMRIFNQEMPPGSASSICSRRNFVCSSTLENRGDKFIGQNFQNIVLDSHANFGEKLSSALSAQPQKPKLSLILKHIFQDGCHLTCIQTLSGKPTRQFVSFWCGNMFIMSLSNLLNIWCWKHADYGSLFQKKICGINQAEYNKSCDQIFFTGTRARSRVFGWFHMAPNSGPAP